MSPGEAQRFQNIVAAGNGALRVGGRIDEQRAGAGEECFVTRQFVKIWQKAGRGRCVEINRLRPYAEGKMTLALTVAGVPRWLRLAAASGSAASRMGRPTTSQSAPSSTARSAVATRF